MLACCRNRIEEALSLLKAYTNIRLDITQRLATYEDVAVAVEKPNKLREALWQQAMAAATNNNMVPTGLFIQTLN
ncbi:MAG: hypothetical protein KGK01_04360 [Bradyrhizobium sp.]|uniref:hypothetical protein n=1 Tax=Bradyrhizobium sp. TaxID=376 RepID=UPI00238A56E0|nr:hypothetical protein [Bradyrhizobium sp.]MDE2241690.1 hypothetical protein [Bradyrhizobium sp.]MDE2470394.1 hypothetical protein [Bradyrhizobium sp.]